MSMTKAHKKALDDTLETFANDDLEVDAAVAHLYRENCLRDEDIDKIKRDNSNKVKAFLEILKKRGIKSFEAFVEYLKESRGQGHLAEELLKNLRDAESNAGEDKVKAQWKTYEEAFYSFGCLNERFEGYHVRIPDKINILLVGKTGSGKSATGNTILGTRDFKESNSTQSVTKTIEVHQVEVAKIKITVIDTPGLFDTAKGVNNEQILLEIAKTMINFSEGIHLFLLVLGSTRFTTEEQETINEIEKVLGKTIYKNAMLVLTNARSNYGDGKQLLKNFLSKERIQGGEFASLVEKVDNKVIAVENFFNDESMKTVHRERLLCSFAEVIQQNDGRVFSNKTFEFAKAKIDQQKKDRNERVEKNNEEAEMERLVRYHLTQTYLNTLSVPQLDAIQSTLENNVDKIMRSCGLQRLHRISKDDVKRYFSKFISEDEMLIVSMKDMKEQQKQQQEESQRHEDQIKMENIVLFYVSRYLKKLSKDELEDLIKKREIGRLVMKQIDDELNRQGLKFESKVIQAYVTKTFFENPTEIRRNIDDKEVQAKKRQLQLLEQKTKVISRLLGNFHIVVDNEDDNCLHQLMQDLDNDQRLEKRLKPLIAQLLNKDAMGDLNIAQITHLFVKENSNFLHSVVTNIATKREQQRFAEEKEMLQNLRKDAIHEISDIINNNLRHFLTGKTVKELKNLEKQIKKNKVPREIVEEVNGYLTKEQQSVVSSAEIESEILVQLGEQQALVNEIKEDAKCFAGSTTIRIKRCGISKISQVKLNDEILVYDENGYVFYDKVYLVSHANETEIVTYVRLQTSSGKELFISPGHLLPVSSLCGTVAARDVSLGNVIFTLQDGVMMPDKVTSVTHELCRGAYCPMTMKGNIVVNDVAASCYTTFLPSRLAHALLSPLRGLFRFTPLPLFNKLLPHDAEEGMPVLLLKCRSMIIMWRSFVEKYTSWKTNE